MDNVEDEDTGWCRKCAEAAALERYRDAKGQEIARLRKNWRRRAKKAFSDAPEALAERQRWHRLKENTKPRQPVDSYVNPLQLCFDTLQTLRRIRGAIRSTSHVGVEEVEFVAETLRRLAWAEEDCDSQIRVKDSTGRKPRKRRVASRTFVCQVCGDTFKASRAAKYCSSACNVAAYRERKRGHKD
jgi:hypothetical protein